MTVKAIVDGKVIRLKLSAGLAQAWRQNRGKTMTEKQAVEFVERKRRTSSWSSRSARSCKFEQRMPEY